MRGDTTMTGSENGMKGFGSTEYVRNAKIDSALPPHEIETRVLALLASDAPMLSLARTTEMLLWR
jgi:hypothetical protein